MNVSDYIVYLGVYQMSNLKNPNVVPMALKKIIVHPDYMYEGSSGDIALVELVESVTFTMSILPICLPSQAIHLAAGTSCWVTGWGNVQEGTPLGAPQTLQKVKLGLINSTSCEAMYVDSMGFTPNYPFILDDMLCAGYKEGQKDACQGDSGGPLVCKVDNVWQQFGLVSWGFGCAEPSRPGVYTKIQYYQNWIKENVPAATF
ncbi:hypothetical protein GDO86_017744, partial [Hymenochirus boettgeri]